MRVILTKLLKDFKFSKGKLLLLLLAASLSGWGISSVVYSYFMTERDFEENFMKTYPADMTVLVENYSEGLENQFLTDENVIDIERREVITARIKGSQDNWMPMMLWAVDDLNNMRYDQFSILEDSNKTKGKILIEQNAYYFLNEDQDSIDLLFQGHEDPTSWKVSGKVHDARQAPAMMEGVIYAYSTSMEQIQPYLVEGRRRFLIETNVSSDKAQLQAVYERLVKITEKSGGRIVGVNIPEPGEHIHQGIIDGVAFLQTSGGTILSIMGIVLLSLILLTWIFPQVSDIGVMKAIGASTGSIFISYTIILGVIVTFGLLIGMPIGYRTASMYNGIVAQIQNFEPVLDMLPFYTHAIVVSVAMIIPLLFGVLPLARAAKTSVNEAMNKTFYTPHKGIFQISQRLITNTRLKYGINNLLRHSQRTMLTILLLAVGVALFFTASNVDNSIRTDMVDFAKTSQYEVLVTLPEEMEMEDVSYLNEVPFIERFLPIHGGRVSYVPPSSGSPELVVARALSSDIVIDKKYVQRGTIDKKCPECIYVSGEEMMKNFESVELGTVVELTTVSGEIRNYIFSGVVSDLVIIGTPFFRFDDEVSKSFNLLAFELKPNLSNEELLAASGAIDDIFIDNGINLLRRTSIKRRLGSIIGHLQPTFSIIKIMGMFTIVIGLVGLIIVLNLTLQERTREIGIMKSIGSPYMKISGLFQQEFLLMILLAITIGALLAIPVAKALLYLISDMVIRHPVQFNNDYGMIGLTIGVLLVLQIIIISIYNRFKIGENARKLLDHNF